MTHPLIAAALARPLTHRVITAYADGATQTHDTRSMQTAELFAIGERRKIGRDLISRNPDMTAGPMVRVVSVSVGTIEQGTLAAEYVDLVGYDPFADDPRMTCDDVRRLIAEIRTESTL